MKALMSSVWMDFRLVWAWSSSAIFFSSARSNPRFSSPFLTTISSFVVPWFFDVLIKADVVDGFDGVLLVGVTGQQHPNGMRLGFLEPGQEADAVDPGHKVIRDDQVHHHFAGVLESLLRQVVRDDVIISLKPEEVA